MKINILMFLNSLQTFYESKNLSDELIFDYTIYILMNLSIFYQNKYKI